MHTAVLALALAAPPPDATASVRAGLTWLAGQQKADGSWAGAGGVEPTTITAYAGLALLMEGSTPARG
ncbi:MAG: hypothetical protein FJ304_13500 [Planctomycetes bacterium]|nr:hypothetical protein [Planctomycetota bacterium]